MSKRRPEEIIPVLSKKMQKLRAKVARAGLHDESVKRQLDNAIRRLILAETLNNRTTYYAICGLQGVGKTTFVTTLYNGCRDFEALNEALKPNIGRGEWYPVIIEERPDIKNVQFEAIVFSDVSGADADTTSRAISREEFQNFSSNNPSGPGDFALAKLLVPGPYVLGDNSAWLLLPGIEPEHEEEPWQDYAWISAEMSPLPFFVVDNQSLSGEGNGAFLDRIKNSCAQRKTKPIVVLSRSDESRDNNSALKHHVIEQIGLSESNVILTGLAANSWPCDSVRQQVKDVLLTRMKYIEFMERRAVSRTEEFLVPATDAALQGIEKFLELEVVVRTPEENHFESVMKSLRKNFDNCGNTLRLKLQNRFSERENLAVRHFQKTLGENDNGNRLGKLWDYVWYPERSRNNVDTEIETSWEKSSSMSPTEDFLVCLKNQIQEKIPIYAEMDLVLDGDKGRLPVLAYVEKQRQSSVVSESLLHNLRALLLPGYVKEASELDPAKFEAALDMLPILALEIIRLKNDLSLRQTSSNDKREEFRSGLVSSFDASGGNFLSACGLILGVDFAVDGQTDSVEKMIVGLGLASGASAAVAANWVMVGVGLASLVNVIRNEMIIVETRERHLGQLAFRQFAQKSVEQAIECFEAAQQFCIDRVSEVLKTDLHLNKKAGDRHTVMLSLAGAKDCLRVLRESCYAESRMLAKAVKVT